MGKFNTSKMTAVVDTDLFHYGCAFAGETRSVLVEHPNGFQREFKTLSEFYGRSRKRDGGYLEEMNKRGGTKLWDEFTYTTIQVAEPLDGVLDSTRNTIDHAVAMTGAKNALHFIGRGESFRLDRSTLLRYKGERVETLKPVHYDAVEDFIINHYNAEVITGIEVDDKVVMESYKNKNRFVLAEDKDARSQPINLFDLNSPKEGIINCSTFGTLRECDRVKNKITGNGYLHLYWQMLAGDSVDAIKPNCFSSKKFGDKMAYNRLKDCTTHKEAFQVMRDVYQMLYPEEIEVVGWRGDTILIDWKYVFNEVWDLIRMLRWEGDEVVGTDVMESLLGKL